MLRFLLKRLLLVIPTFIGITLLVFAMIRLVPGDPVEALAGEGHGMSEERYQALRHQFGFDRPLFVQYLDYVGRAARGDLGHSFATHEPVMREFLDRFPATVELSLCAIILALVIGIPAGMIAALKRNTAWDYSIMGASLTGFSMPIFWWGLLLILFFSVFLGWTPVSGRIAIEYDISRSTGFMLIDAPLAGNWGAFKSALAHLILPTIVLSTIPLAIISRMTRSTLLETLREDYIRAVRAKGASEWRVVGVHALRNALIPIVTVIGLQVGTLLAGAILTETIFSWPGVGKWLVNAIQRRDYPVIQGGILLTAIAVIVVNIVVDLLYGLINPKLSADG